jgi:hypothetical protein
VGGESNKMNVMVNKTINIVISIKYL